MIWQHNNLVDSIIDLEQEGLFIPGAFYMEFACSLQVCMELGIISNMFEI